MLVCVVWRCSPVLSGGLHGYGTCCPLIQFICLPLCVPGFQLGKTMTCFCPRLNALLLQWVIAQTILVLLLSAGSPGDTVPKLAQAGWSHSMSGADSEVASRPYESIGPQRTCITLIPPKTSVSSTTTSQNGLGWRGLWRSHAPVPGLEQD